MIYYCTKYQANVIPESQDCIGDEKYEYCPHCKNDMYLEDQREGVGFTPPLKPIILPKFVPDKKDTVTYFLTNEEQDIAAERYLKAIEDYQQHYETHGPEAAKEMYLNG